MSFFENVNRKWSIKKQKLSRGVYIDIKTPKLQQDVEFILFSLPKKLVKGIEIIEEIYDVEAESHQIIVKSTMDVMDIKRQIGKFIFREKRWEKLEEVSKYLLAEEMIDMDMFKNIYDTHDYLKIYEIVNQDVFAVYYGNEDMTFDEVQLAINSLYIKELTNKEIIKENNLDQFVNDLFNM